MHQKRQEITTKLPLPRKGTTYVARASSHLAESVPVVIAVRDMLHLAHTAAEVKEMIKQGLLKVNGRPVRRINESIRLFNHLSADKEYSLSLLPTGKFAFIEAAKKDQRLCKVTGKTLLPKSITQLNFHDGTNAITKDKIGINESVYVDFSGKIKSHVALEKGKSAFVISGKYAGHEGKIDGVEDGEVKVMLNDKEEPVTLEKTQVAAL